MHKHTMTGVQSLNNFSYEGEGLRAWCAYNMGPGKFFTLGILAQLVLHKEQQILPLYYHSEDQTRKLEPWQRRDLYNRLLFNPAPLGQIPPPIAKRKKSRTGCHSLGPGKDVSKCTSHFLLCTGILMWESTLQGFNARLNMTRSSANGQKPASPWLVDIFSMYLPPRLQPLPTNLTIETCLLLRRDGPSKRSKMPWTSPKMWETIYGRYSCWGKRRVTRLAQEMSQCVWRGCRTVAERRDSRKRNGWPLCRFHATSAGYQPSIKVEDRFAIRMLHLPMLITMTIETPAIRARQQIRPELEL